ncbi:hypothetical protein KC660_00035 [Candidatus Dojkabacteria bacterium]|uniref:Uncharacterized protein n=1 Tax=Candidatus Dojkabacteria bacterium TaxID=2099670 RepID=A0A955L300_9BACT|nr:hypothetical protein [Candidatus Dojkabacteria bacterium]
MSVPAGGHAKSRHVLKSRSDLPDGSHLLTDITGLRETVEETDLPLPYSHARPLGLARQTLPSRRSSDGNGLVNYLCYVWSTVGMIKKDSEDRVPVTFGPGKGENDMSATEIMRLMTLSSIAMLAMMMSQDRARY